MKDSAAMSLEQQALQVQASQLLPMITRKFFKLGYQNMAHQRISQQADNTQIYQGITRAQHEQFGDVMIRWQLSMDDCSSEFHDEAKVLRALEQNHKNLIAIAPSVLAFDILHLKVLEKQQTLTLLVMPYYAQGSLAKYLTQPLTELQKHQLIMQAARLIAHLHNAGLSHGDIKPSNFLINNKHFINTKNPALLLTDFALAKLIDPSSVESAKKNNLKTSSGTPAYLAPECWQGQNTSVQSDIYAFGIMLYEILMGERAYKIDNQSYEPIRDWAIQHCQQSIPLLPSQYRRYQLILAKALAKRVEKRYLSMEEVLEDLSYL
ncbi:MULTISPECIES: serine/threonine protein kinase [unclassified Psychrobacter]|uniref:serine/threonine protein kinase n=1 Tax=unclassified Psychrobacter TaxID=196806 RepID=UPI003FD27921